MGQVKGSLQPVHYDAYAFEETKAKSLHNSSGTKKGRLHLLSYDGMEGGDRHAVVAERMTFDPGKERLGLWDRQFNILVEDDSGAWYKINKNSFLKRMNPSVDLDIEEGTGICKNFKGLVEARSEALVKLQAKSNATTLFEKEFLHQLSRGNNADAYKQILFMPVEDKPIALQAIDEPVLIISYERKGKKADVRPFDLHFRNWHKPGQAVRVHVDYAQYKRILSGHSIARSTKGMIKNEPIGLPEGELRIGSSGVSLNFNSDTRPSDMEKYLAEQHVNYQRKNTIYVTKGKEEEKIFQDIDADMDLDKITPRPTKNFSARIRDVPSFVEMMKAVLNKGSESIWVK